MTGWRPLIKATVRLANRNGVRLRQGAANGRLFLEPAGTSEPPRRHREIQYTTEPLDYVGGVLAGASALSDEICQSCGDPGDPVRDAGGRRATRCGDCRAANDEVLRRPPWRRPRARRYTRRYARWSRAGPGGPRTRGMHRRVHRERDHAQQLPRRGGDTTSDRGQLKHCVQVTGPAEGKRG